MLVQRLHEEVLKCDKCGGTIRNDICCLSAKSRERLSRKRSFCGRCIQARIHRNDPDFDHQREFKFDRRKLKQRKADLELLSSFFC